MYRLIQQAEDRFAVEKDGAVISELSEDDILCTVHDYKERDKKEYLFREILNAIADLGCVYCIHQLHDLC